MREALTRFRVTARQNPTDCLSGIGTSGRHIELMGLRVTGERTVAGRSPDAVGETARARKYLKEPMKRTPIRPVSHKRAAENKVRAKVKQELIAERGEKCERCGKNGPVDQHERVRRSAGASITDKIVSSLLCRVCHSEIHANVAQSLKDGWLVSRHSQDAIEARARKKEANRGPSDLSGGV